MNRLIHSSQIFLNSLDNEATTICICIYILYTVYTIYSHGYEFLEMNPTFLPF